MATDLMLPEGLAPSNLHLAPSDKARFVESDVFHIAERLRREVSPRLHVIEVTGQKNRKWYIMEKCDDGEMRFVAKDDELDGRVIELCQKLIRIPFQVRLAAVMKANEEWEQLQHEEEMDRLYDRIGARMQRQLWHDGFIETRATSYPTKAITPVKV